jgi:drug/metabolite transporter (DMT)-like permease
LVVAALLFAVVAAFTKAASRLPGSEIALFRALVGLATCGLAAARRPFRAHNVTGLLLRGALGGAAVLCYFTAITHLPMGVATLLNYTAPVFTAVWAALFLGERVGPGALVALILTMVGVTLIASSKEVPGAVGLGRWEALGLFSAMLSGGAIATIREVRRTDGAWEIFAAFCLLSALIALGPAVRDFVRPTPREAWLLIGVGLSAVGAQLALTYALRYVRASLAGILSQLTPITALLLGWLLYGERIGGRSLAGAAVTLVGITWGAWLAAEPEPIGG